MSDRRKVQPGKHGKGVAALKPVMLLPFHLGQLPVAVGVMGGYTFTFDRLINTTGESNLCFRPLEPKFETGLYLVWKKNQRLTKQAKLFLERFKQIVMMK